MRRVPSQKISTSATVAMNWMTWIRLIVSGAPNRTMSGKVISASGKNSSIEGPWNPPPSSAAVWAMRVAM